MANELGIAESYLGYKLGLDANLVAAVSGMFSGVAPSSAQFAPDGTARPYITWSWQGSPDITFGDSGARFGVQPLYLVKVIMQTANFDDIQAIADMIDDNLQ